jgi:ribose transport system substrate-binding protein
VGGREAVASAKSILIDCAKPAKTQMLPTQLVTQANAAEMYAKGNR